MDGVFITFLASFLIWLMFAGLGFLWIVDGKIKKEQVLHALFAVILAWVTAEMMKSIFPTLRPFHTNGFPPLTLTVPGGGAFPSSHTAVAFALAITVWLHDKKVGLFFILIALGVGLGRILANVHYPLDIVGGAFIGWLTAILVQHVHLPHLLPPSKRKK